MPAVAYLLGAESSAIFEEIAVLVDDDDVVARSGVPSVYRDVQVVLVAASPADFGHDCTPGSPH